MKHQTDFFNGPWHATSMQRYCTCGAEYLINSQQPPSETTSLAMFKGTVLHRMLFLNTRPNKETPYEAALSYELDNLEHPLSAEPDWKLFEAELESTWRQTVEHLPPHEVEAAEWPFSEYIGKYLCEGTIDAILQIDGKRIVVDWKNYKTLPSQFTLDTSLQLSIYDYAVSIHRPVDAIAWCHIKDYQPYTKVSYKSPDAFSRTESLSQWFSGQDLHTTPAGKIALPVGHLRGPGLHYTERSMDDRRELVKEVARIIQGIRMRIFNRCQNMQICDMCRFQTECRTLRQTTNIKVSKAEAQLIKEMESL